MDNVAVRTRYPRHSMPVKKKRKNVREAGGYKDKLAKQMVISVLILLVAGILKTANTSATNYICDKASGILSQNIEIQGLYRKGEDLFHKVFKTDGYDGSDSGDKLEDEDVGDSNENLNPDEQDPNNGDDLESQNQGAMSTPSPTPNSSPTPAAQSTKATPSPKAATPLAAQNKSVFITPVEGPLGEPFGERIHPVTNKLAMHKGVDIEANQGATIKAAAAGEVVEAGYEKTLGYYIKIQHTTEMSTIYAHCSELVAKKGQNVKQGDVIAKVGSTGLSTGAHLHFEVWKDGKAVNPLDYIKVPEK